MQTELLFTLIGVPFVWYSQGVGWFTLFFITFGMVTTIGLPLKTDNEFGALAMFIVLPVGYTFFAFASVMGCIDDGCELAVVLVISLEWYLLLYVGAIALIILGILAGAVLYLVELLPSKG